MRPRRSDASPSSPASTADDKPTDAGWRSVELPGRGTTRVIDRPGPTAAAPTIVLLHGLAGTGPLNWGRVIEPLAERFRVVALDHRGHGQGIPPGGHFRLEDCADDVVALLEVLGVRRVVLVGYSMGGAIAQLTWHRHPRRVAGLVLLATAARFQVPAASELATRVVAEAARSDDRIPVVGHSANALRGAVRALAAFDARPWLEQGSVPAAVLVTTRDLVVPPRLQRELATLVTNGRATEVARGHMVVVDHRTTARMLRVACDQVVREAGLELRWWASLPLLARRTGHTLRARLARRSRTGPDDQSTVDRSNGGPIRRWARAVIVRPGRRR